jgi:hypothetical protein
VAGPDDCLVELVVVEAFDLGPGEVLGQAGSELSYRAVGGQRHPADRAVVVAHEAEVAEHARYVLPPGEVAGVHDDAWQLVVGLQPRVRGRG